MASVGISENRRRLDRHRQELDRIKDMLSLQVVINTRHAIFFKVACVVSILAFSLAFFSVFGVSLGSIISLPV